MEMCLLFFSFKYNATGRKCSPLLRISIGIPSGKVSHLLPGLLCTQRLHSGVSCHLSRSRSKQQPITMPPEKISVSYTLFHFQMQAAAYALHRSTNHRFSSRNRYVSLQQILTVYRIPAPPAFRLAARQTCSTLSIS